MQRIQGFGFLKQNYCPTPYAGAGRSPRYTGAISHAEECFGQTAEPDSRVWPGHPKPIQIGGFSLKELDGPGG